MTTTDTSLTMPASAEAASRYLWAGKGQVRDLPAASAAAQK